MKLPAGLLCLGALAGCHHGRAMPPADPAPQQPTLLGSWDYQSPPPPAAAARPTLGMGLHVVIAIERSDAGRCEGHVRLWFAGDAGSDPRSFGAVTGEVSMDGRRVTLTIPYARGGADPIRVAVRWEGEGDTLTVERSWRGAAPGPFAAGARFVRTARATSSP